MKTKTGLLVLGLFTIAGALTVACGSSSSDGDNTSTAGTSGNSAGTSSGGKGTAGTSSSAGTTNNGAGTGNNGGTANNNGGNANNGGRNNTGGFNPGLGGAGPDLPDCPATAETGEACTRMNGGNNVCQVDDTTFCVCQGQNDATWTCTDLGDIGAGGAGPIGGAVTCPANAKNGDTCTGLGLCPGSQTCGCGFGTVYCQ